MTQKKDLRVIKSEKAIRSAFLELIREKGYANITITDIANKAMINRKTFYMHYETKEQLYNKLTDEFIEVIAASNLLDSIMTLNSDYQRKAVINLLEKIKKHKDVFNIFANDKTNPVFINKLKSRLINDLIHVSHTDDRAKNSLFSFELLSEAYFSLFYVVLQWWVNTENISPDYVINMILEFFSPKPLELLGLNLKK